MSDPSPQDPVVRAGDRPSPMERALALVKTAVTPALTGPVDERREVMELVVHWCVEAYYAA